MCIPYQPVWPVREQPRRGLSLCVYLCMCTWICLMCVLVYFWIKINKERLLVDAQCTLHTRTFRRTDRGNRSVNRCSASKHMSSERRGFALMDLTIIQASNSLCIFVTFQKVYFWMRSSCTNVHISITDPFLNSNHSYDSSILLFRKP